jgi:two-component system, OmpR family, response regulator RegX3
VRAPAIDTTVLFVDDDPAIAEAFGTALELEGFSLEVAHDGREALECFERAAADVVVLDVVLPGASGITVCERIRKVSSVPILMISGRAWEADVVAALEAGADDYLIKPFGTAELVARIRAALRRSSPPEPTDTVRRVGNLTLSPERGRAWLRGRALELTDKEFALLEALMRNPDRVVTRAALVREVWGGDGSVTKKALDATVRRLRDKLGDADGSIVTVRGVGFRFEPPG